jgi:predicted  nucleic acid-binding Zn-ribbon protein
MSQEDDTRGLIGLPIEVATERVAARKDRDPQTVREVLDEISEDGTVTRAALADALADLSEVIAAPESRIETARGALSDAREAAEPVTDTETVRSRMETFEAELSALDDRVETFESNRSSLVKRARDPEDLYVIAGAIGELRSRTATATEDADLLLAEIETFERKLCNPGEWVDELNTDIDAAEEAIEELLEVTSGLSDPAGDGDEIDPALRWADTTLQHHMQKLLLADIRTERDALRQLIAREGLADVTDEIDARLEDLETLRAGVGRRLDEVSRPSWREAHGETIESFARVLAEFDPPVNWATLQDELQTHREQLVDAE